MREMSLEEVKATGLGTLKYFASFCGSHHLRYYLAYGTLIGAVRHQGFIPWDDDVDVWMPRADYECLIALHSELDEYPYKLISPETEPRFLSPFAKLSRCDTLIRPSRFVTGFLYGSSIDIFPLDVFPSDKDLDAANAEYKAIRGTKLEHINAYHAYTDGKVPPLLKRVATRVAYQMATLRYGSMADCILSFSQWLAGERHRDGNGYLTTVAGSTLYEASWFENTVELPFEDGRFVAPKGFDSILARRYGDYLTFPPESERVIPHSFAAYFVG